MNKKNVLVIGILIVILIFIIIVVVWNKYFGIPEEQTTKALFGNEFEILSMPQIHTFHTDIHTKTFGTDISQGFRTYNPSLIKHDDNMIYVYRISNYTGCQDLPNIPKQQALNKDGSIIKSYIALSLDNERTVDLVLPNFSGKVCAQGFEDPRPIISSDRKYMYIAANARSGKSCAAEMWLLRILMKDVEKELNHIGIPRSITVDDVLKLRTKDHIDGSPEKNWMPFFHNDELHFVYSVNPHIILKCDLETGLCTKIHQSYNKTIPKNFRGGSQIKHYRDPNTNKKVYIGITHVQQTHNSYVTQFYSFSPKGVFKIIGLSPNFIFDESKDITSSSIQFVSGFEIFDDVAYITYGEHDCNSKLFKIEMSKVLKAIANVDQSEIEIIAVPKYFNNNK